MPVPKVRFHRVDCRKPPLFLRWYILVDWLLHTRVDVSSSTPRSRQRWTKNSRGGHSKKAAPAETVGRSGRCVRHRFRAVSFHGFTSIVRSSQDFYVSLRGDGPPPVRLRQGVGLLRPVLQVSKGMLRLEGRRGGICFGSGQKEYHVTSRHCSPCPFCFDARIVGMKATRTASVKVLGMLRFHLWLAWSSALSLPSSSPGVRGKAGCATDPSRSDAGSAAFTLMEGCDGDATDAADLCLRNANVGDECRAIVHVNTV